MIKCKNFNGFIMATILEKMNAFCEENCIYSSNIISICHCRDGSVNLFYYDGGIYD